MTSSTTSVGASSSTSVVTTDTDDRLCGDDLVVLDSLVAFGARALRGAARLAPARLLLLVALALARFLELDLRDLRDLRDLVVDRLLEEDLRLAFLAARR